MILKGKEPKKKELLRFLRKRLFSRHVINPVSALMSSRAGFLSGVGHLLENSLHSPHFAR